jgi:hypothetical protein
MVCPRTMPTYQYPQPDAKPVYPSGWANPYSDDNSPVETYGLDHSSAYLPAPTLTTTTSNVYEAPNRWSLPTTRSAEYEPSTYADQEPAYVTHGLPHVQPDNRVPTTNEILSPLNMSSLQMNLPERSHVQRIQVPETATPQRQLPMPQPSPALTARNVVDQMQDQRLRSAQVGTTHQISNTTFVKSALPWNTDGDTRATISSEPILVSRTAHNISPASRPSTAECTLEYPQASTSIHSYNAMTDTASQLQLDFSTTLPFDVMSMPASTITYSNFRDYRGSVPSPTLSQRPNSHPNACIVKSNNSPKRNSLSDDSPRSYASTSGHQCTSPNHSHSTDTSALKTPCRGPHEGKHAPFRSSPRPSVKSNL